MSNIPAQTVVCPCCDLPHSELVKNMWVSKAVCHDCIFVWYDGAGMDGGARHIRQESRVRQGFVMETYEP